MGVKLYVTQHSTTWKSKEGKEGRGGEKKEGKCERKPGEKERWERKRKMGGEKKEKEEK